MYQRQARSRVRQRTVRFRDLRLDVSDHDAPDGTLRECENLRPAGPVDAPYYTPVAASVLERDLSDLDGTLVAIGRQVRNVRGDLSTQADSGLDRKILVTSEKVYLWDKANSRLTAVYTFSAADTTRRVQFSAVGEYTVLCVSNGTAPGAPEITLALRDETCFEIRLPTLPFIDCSAATSTNYELIPTEVSVFGYRWAYVFADGTYGPISRPVWHPLAVPVPGEGAQLTFTVGTFESADNPYASALLTAWSDLNILRGIAIFISSLVPYSTANSNAEQLFDLEYYKITEIDRTRANWDTPASVSWTDDQDLISTYPALADTGFGANLLYHKITGAACFSYNGQLLLGDVAYDFRKPQITALLHGYNTGTEIQPIPDISGDYGVRIGVTIRTNKGEYQRISDPVYYDTVDAAAVEVVGTALIAGTANGYANGHLWYGDVRATQMQIYVNQLSAGWKLLRTVAMQESTTGNQAIATYVADLDLKGTVTTDMPTAATVNAVKDRDPNRIVVSDGFNLFHFPAGSALYTAGSDEDAIIGFSANTLAISEGQFGEAPVIVLGKISCQALLLGTTVLFVRSVPLSDRGCISRYGFANVAGTIFFVSDDGVWALTPQLSPDPVSRPVHAFEGDDDILDELDTSTAVTYVKDGYGNQELWVSTASRIWCLALRYQRWFTIDRIRQVIARDGTRVLSFDSVNNKLNEEAEFVDVGILTPAGIECRIVTAPLKLQLPGHVKRYYRLAVRQRDEMDEINYQLFDPLDPNNYGADIDAEVEYSQTLKKAYLESLSILAPRLVLEGGTQEEGPWVLAEGGTQEDGPYVRAEGGTEADVNPKGTHIVSIAEGSPVVAGLFHRLGLTDSISLRGLGRDVYVVLEMKGKPGQGVEGLDIDYEGRALHRSRRRNNAP